MTKICRYPSSWRGSGTLKFPPLLDAALFAKCFGDFAFEAGKVFRGLAFFFPKTASRPASWLSSAEESQLPGMTGGTRFPYRAKNKMNLILFA